MIDYLVVCMTLRSAPVVLVFQEKMVLQSKSCCTAEGGYKTVAIPVLPVAQRGTLKGLAEDCKKSLVDVRVGFRLVPNPYP